jgi:hypothetical protein
MRRGRIASLRISGKQMLSRTRETTAFRFWRRDSDLRGGDCGTATCLHFR